MNFQFADPRGAVLASLLFGAIAVVIGAGISAILKRLAAPAGEPSYYGTTRRARTLIGSGVAIALLAIFWFQFWGGFYRLTVKEGAVELTYLGPTRHYAINLSGVQVGWVPAGKMQQALQLTTSEGKTFTSTATSLSTAQRLMISSLLSGHAR